MYEGKHQVLRQLLQESPDDFIIDSQEGGILGITHVPTNFRIHIPREQFPSSYLRSQKSAGKDVVTYVPRNSLKSVLKHGLLSGEALLGNQEALQAAAKGRGQTSEDLSQQLRDKLKSWHADAVRGPNVSFGEIPKSVLDANPLHPLNTGKYSPVRVDLRAILRDIKKTRIHGQELMPYAEYKKRWTAKQLASEQDDPSLRHRDLSPEELRELMDSDQDALWARYADEEQSGLYAGDVPHASIITPDGRIDPKYLTIRDKEAADRDVAALPYRATAEAILRNADGTLAARINHMPGKSFFKAPGGGIDSGESPEVGLLREIEEETGIIPENLRLAQRVQWDWPDTWAYTPKQKERYAQFRGEDAHIYVGDVKSTGTPTSQEGDAWDEHPRLDEHEAVEFLRKSLDPKGSVYQGQAFDTYKRAQLAAILQALHDRGRDTKEVATKH
jgi:8-oxo-dGTP pyrophosphatase MutT (NUDIX family)